MPNDTRGETFYIAAKVPDAIDDVVDIRDTLTARGFTCIYDWTQVTVPKPYKDHPDAAARAAEDMARAVHQCDNLIVITHARGKGLHIETGGALVASIILHYIHGRQAKRLFVVGDDCDGSQFYFHPHVTRCPTIADLYGHFPSRT